MRRILSIALAALMILSVATVGVFTVSADTSAELPANAKAINDGDDFATMQAGGYYYLAADITIDSTYSRAFTGTLDGQGHTVTTTVPLFSNLNGSTIKNLTIAGSIDDTEDANAYLGALALAAGNVTIDNVHNTADVLGVEKASVAGLVGFCRGGSELYIKNSSNSGDLAGQMVGGILAAGDGEYMEIVNCTNSGDLSCLKTSANAGFGGMIANTSDAEASFLIDNCINTGTIVGPRPGGIFGTTESIRNAVITDCINMGDITSETNYAGGIACRIDSYSPATFRNCVNTGNVSALKSQIGGMLGYMGSSNNTDGSAVFYGCVNTGTISVLDFENTAQSCDSAGMAGKITGRAEFYNCVNTGDLYGTKAVAGMIAHTGSANAMSDHVVSGCYVSGTYHTNAKAVKADDRTGTSAGLIGYGWGACFVTNCVVAADIISDFDLVPSKVDNTQALGAFLGYTNNNNGVYRNNHFIGTLTAGENVQKVICLNSVAADITHRVGNYIRNNYSANEYPLYWSIVDGASNLTGIRVNAADYTTEYIVNLLNENLGYKAFAAVTDASSNEAGLTGVVPTVVMAGDADPSAEAVAVGTAEEFLAMKPNGSYYLTADITLPSSYEGVFTGILDGKGYTLNVTNPVFDVLSSATVSNLTIKGTIVKTVSEETRTIADYAGALANIGNGCTVTNVTNRANVSAYKHVGGLFGEMQGGELIACVNYGNICGNVSYGGLVGMALHEPVTYIGCVNNGTFAKNKGVGASGVGGIVGRVNYTKATFDSCVNNMLVNAPVSGARAGGIVGYVYSPVITNEDGQTNPNDRKILSNDLILTNCVNNASITGYDQVGGLVGWAEAFMTLTDCVNNGAVQSVQNYTGGLVGRAGANWGNANNLHVFTNCVNTGTVTTHRQYAGGIVAYSQDNVTFENCVNTGTVTGEEITYGGTCANHTPKCHSGSSVRFVEAGGLIGRCNYDVKAYNCVNTGDVSGNSRVGGLVGVAGYANAKGIDGNHEFLNCFVGGSVYNTHAYVNANVEYADGTGGIVGTAYNVRTTSMTVQYCAVTADISADVESASGPRAVCGLVGFCDTSDAYYLNNYFAGTLSDGGSGLGLCSATVTTNTAAIREGKNVDGNCVVRDITTYYVDRKGSTYLDYTFEGYFYRRDIASGELCVMLKNLIGKDVFFQELGVDAAPSAVEGGKYMVRYDSILNEYYNITSLSQERPGPSDTTEPEDSTTEEVTTEEVTTEEITTEEVTTEEITTEEITTDEITTDEVSTDAGTTVTPDVSDTEPVAEGGCGSVVGASLAIAVIALVAPAALMLKKRDEE